MAKRPNREEETPDAWTSQKGPGGSVQSGDLQGLNDDGSSESESVKELLEEGQYYEAEVLSGFENSPTADVSEVRTRQVPEDDVPLEYQEEDERDTN
jgi:hypothetical protein